MDKEKIIIKIFRRTTNDDVAGFYSVFSKNNYKYLEHKTSAIAEMAYNVAGCVKECRKNNVSVVIKFPHEIYEIDCQTDVRVATLYESISGAERKAFWEKFSLGDKEGL